MFKKLPSYSLHFFSCELLIYLFNLLYFFHCIIILLYFYCFHFTPFFLSPTSSSFLTIKVGVADNLLSHFFSNCPFEILNWSFHCLIVSLSHHIYCSFYLNCFFSQCVNCDVVMSSLTN